MYLITCVPSGVKVTACPLKDLEIPTEGQSDRWTGERATSGAVVNPN